MQGQLSINQKVVFMHVSQVDSFIAASCADDTQGAKESNSTEILVKFTVSMHRRSILLLKAPYVTSVLVMRSCYTSGVILESSSEGRRFGKRSFRARYEVPIVTTIRFPIEDWN